MRRLMCIVHFLPLVIAQIPQEAVDSGRSQYQLLQERSNLPHYGNCWRNAVQHIHEGCSSLSEETQSDMALHLTNCFLEMSGDETYHCEMEKKQNLRKICLSNLSDRAFNVYTEFYTHTQNICWFLKAQVWQDVMVENTNRLGRQLEMSVANQQRLMRTQEESIALQEKLLKHGALLEDIVQGVIESIADSHHKILGLQSWLIEEVSWIDTVIFYVISVVFVFVLTSPQCTKSGRLPVLLLFCANIFLERFLCSKILQSNGNKDARTLHDKVNFYVWFLRYSLVFLSSLIIILSIYFYKDYAKCNNVLLEKIYKQNAQLLQKLRKTTSNESSFNILNEISNKLSFSNKYNHYSPINKHNGIYNNAVSTPLQDNTPKSTILRTEPDSSYFPVVLPHNTSVNALKDVKEQDSNISGSKLNKTQSVRRYNLRKTRVDHDRISNKV